MIWSSEREKKIVSENFIWVKCIQNTNLYIYIWNCIHRIAANVTHVYVYVCVRIACHAAKIRRLKSKDQHSSALLDFMCASFYFSSYSIFSSTFNVLRLCHVYIQFARTIKLMRAHSYNGEYTFSMRITHQKKKKFACKWIKILNFATKLKMPQNEEKKAIKNLSSVKHYDYSLFTAAYIVEPFPWGKSFSFLSILIK